MTFHSSFPLFSLAPLAVFVAVACTPDAPQPTSSGPTTAASAPVTSGAASAPSADVPMGGRGDGRGGGQKAKRFGDASVFVDGKPRAVLRFLEMPASVKVYPKKLEDREVARYRLGEYLESLGVDLAKVKELHIVGGRGRTSILAGSEVLKHRETLLFSFSKGEGGKARVEWPDTKIEVNTTIDTIVAVCVYLELKPPAYDRKKLTFIDESGAKIQGIPYAKPEESLRGTRVYADGKLMGSVKRKRLPDSVLAKSYTPEKPRFSLDAYLASLGIDAAKLTTVAVVRGDFVVARLDAAAWKKAREKAEFSLVPGSEGRMLVHLPAEDGETSLPASSVLVFAAPAPKRVTSAPVVKAVPGSEENQAEAD